MQTVTNFVNVTVVLSIRYWSKEGRKPEWPVPKRPRSKKPQDSKDLYIKENGESNML